MGRTLESSALIVIAGLVIAGMGLSCAAGGDICLTPEVGCGESPTPSGTAQNVSFANDITIGAFTTCSSSASCHGGQGQDDFSTDLANGCQAVYDELLEDRVAEATTGPRLDPATDPADPANSFFVRKSINDITHTGGISLAGSNYDLVVAWIGEGAINDCP